MTWDDSKVWCDGNPDANAIQSFSAELSSNTIPVQDITTVYATNVIPNGADEETINWTSSNPQVATVEYENTDAEANVQGISAGTAVITGTAGDGVTASVTVTVT